MDEPPYRLKISRAKKHLEELRAELSRYEGQQPCVATRDFDADPDPMVFAYRAKIAQQPNPILPLIIGDCVHNLRAALDYAVIALSTARGRRQKFPVYTKDIWAKDEQTGAYLHGTAEDRRTYRRAIKGIHPDAAALIQALQPYHRGDAAPLYILTLLAGIDNADKHQELATVAFGITNIDARLIIDGIYVVGQQPPGSVEDGGGVAFLRLTRSNFETEFNAPDVFDRIAAGKADVQVEIHGTPQVALKRAEVEGYLILPNLLIDLIQFTENIVARLEAWMPQRFGHRPAPL